MFDSYTMNTVKSRMTEKECYELRDKFLISLGLGKTALTDKRATRKGQWIGDVSLTEVRRSLSLYIRENSNMTLHDVAVLCGLSEHTAVRHHEKTGCQFRNVNDEKFMTYYNKLISL